MGVFESSKLSLRSSASSDTSSLTPVRRDDPEQERDYPGSWNLAIIVIALCMGTLLVAIDNTIIAVALPQIATDFSALNDIGWYGSAYLLTVTALQPSMGNVYKYFDLKITYLVSIVVFEVGSVLCAAAQNSTLFIVGRAIAGVGAAGLFQGALGIITFSVRLERRPLYLAVVVSSFAIATCAGPILGGAFTTNISWRWCFWINVPIGGVDLLLILAFLHLKGVTNEDRRRSLKSKLLHMDLAGATVLIASVACLILALQWGGNTYAWRSSTIIGLFVGFGLLLVVFCALQFRLGEKATVPVRFLKQRTVLMASCFTFLISVSNFADGYYLPFYFQAAQGVSATQSGISFISLAFPEIIAIMASGAIATKTGHYVPLMVLGSIVGAIGTGFLTSIGLTTTTPQWAAFMVITGIGIGLGTNVPYTSIQAVLHEDDVPVGNAVIIFFQNLGGSLAIPIGNALLVDGLQTSIPKVTSALDAQTVISVGPTKLAMLTRDPALLEALRGCYVVAVQYTLYLSLAAIAVALPFALGMEWRRLKIPEKPGGDGPAANQDVEAATMQQANVEVASVQHSDVGSMEWPLPSPRPPPRSARVASRDLKGVSGDWGKQIDVDFSMWRRSLVSPI